MLKYEETIHNDIIAAASLGFHKAIIGITQLHMTEKAKSKNVSVCRLSQAVLTYYIVYHIFTVCMLISDKYDASKQKHNNDFTLEELNSVSEKPEVWNRQRTYESDYATRIQHKDIKAFCDKLRQENYSSLNTLEKLLFESFVKSPTDDTTLCIKGLYEKLCYVRDRAIYRPSVVRTKSDEIVQTSLHVKKEIDSLPNSDELYEILYKMYKVFLNEKKTNDDYKDLLYNIWFSPIEETEEDLESIGYNIEAYEKINAYMVNKEEHYMPSFICHMLEIYDNIEEIIYYNEKYWEPLYKEFRA